MPGRWCSSIGCSKSDTKTPGLHFFKVPKDTERAGKWVENSRRDFKHELAHIQANVMFCADHFEDSQFTNTKKNRLIWNAVPTLFKVPNPPPRVEMPAPIEPPARKEVRIADERFEKGVRDTLAYIEGRKRAHRERKMRSEVRKQKRAENQALRRLRNKTKRVESRDKRARLIAEVAPLLSKDQLILFEAQIRNSGKKRKAYSDDFKELATSIVMRSPETYEFLAQKLDLPQKTTVKKWL